MKGKCTHRLSQPSLSESLDLAACHWGRGKRSKKQSVLDQKLFKSFFKLHGGIQQQWFAKNITQTSSMKTFFA